MLFALGTIQSVHDRVALLYPALEHPALVLVANLNATPRTATVMRTITDGTGGLKYLILFDVCHCPLSILTNAGLSAVTTTGSSVTPHERDGGPPIAISQVQTQTLFLRPP